MSENEKNVVSGNGGNQSVDDILAEILNADGSFRDEFSGLASKYIGEEDISASSPGVDLSDRRDEAGVRDKAVYESADINFVRGKTIDERIEEKIPDEFREIYSEASSEAQRPEYTSTGSVRYPTMGVGASEQRVVFDADWEEKAKAEAARLERVRQDRMLRGDSTYVRGFVTSSANYARKNPFIDELSDAPSAPVTPEGSLYIDPLSKDEDFEKKPDTSAYYNDSKKPFFQEGFSVVQKNNVAASGKTEDTSGGKSESSDSTISQEDAYSAKRAGSLNSSRQEDTSWLQIDDRSPRQKKKGAYKKKTGKNSKGARVGTVTDKINLEEKKSESDEKNIRQSQEAKKRRVYLYDGKDAETVADETKGLRSTVAEIVDKYNKRNEEDEKRRLEELARLEEEKRLEQQLIEQRRAHIEKLKKNMSPELAEAVDCTEDDYDDSEGYEDFSTEPVSSKKDLQKKSQDIRRIIPAAKVEGADYLEKLNSSENKKNTAHGKDTRKEKDGNNKRNGQPVKNNRRKDKK